MGNTEKTAIDNELKSFEQKTQKDNSAQKQQTDAQTKQLTDQITQERAKAEKDNEKAQKDGEQALKQAHEEMNIRVQNAANEQKMIQDKAEQDKQALKKQLDDSGAAHAAQSHAEQQGKVESIQQI